MKFKDHLDEADMSYWEHRWHGLVNGTRLIIGGLASYVHSFIPSVLAGYSILLVAKLYKEIRKREHGRKILSKFK